LEKEKTGWKRMKFRKNEYWVNKDNVKPIDLREDNKKVSNKKKPCKTSKKKAFESEKQPLEEQDMICIYTDGASSGNPGPSGIGILLLYGSHEKEISKYIGSATNNIAELEAIRVALLELKKTDIPVKIFTDSSWMESKKEYGINKINKEDYFKIQEVEVLQGKRACRY